MAVQLSSLIVYTFGESAPEGLSGEAFIWDTMPRAALLLSVHEALYFNWLGSHKVLQYMPIQAVSDFGCEQNCFLLY